MREAQKQQIEKFIELLAKTSEAIKAAVQTNPREVEKLINECRQGLFVVKKLLQESEGIDCKALQLLAQYEQTLPEGDDSLWEEIWASVDVIKVKKEIVFLPYNASMWDSLESVWMAAKDDEDCDVYVVPIPYFDKDSEGFFKEMHWEGDRFPSYVPITRYEDYDICARKPDVIFIHNPYDECNRVTSVHPDYYAKVLKDYTEKLVYIPYFVLDESITGTQNEMKHVEDFCYLPGTRYADYVVLQSDKIKEIYICEYLRKAFINNEKVSRTDLEKRFLALGSPKLDKVIESDIEYEIPKEWQSIIQNPDGKRKKVILYNTSLKTFLYGRERLFPQMQKVFNMFYEKRDAVTLLWRPHPLMLKTIESSYPELKEEYESIVRNYCQEGWGIYDDTSELNRAIAISDAYYGDPSSVVTLYQRAGKPVMIQEI